MDPSALQKQAAVPVDSVVIETPKGDAASESKRRKISRT
jgi:hypothetical protein